jgi:hypothetical protein
VALCPNVVPYSGSCFDCCDLLQRSVIHYAAERKTSSAMIFCRPLNNDRNGMLPVYLAAAPKIEAPAWSPSDSGRGFYIGCLSGRILRGLGGRPTS